MRVWSILYFTECRICYQGSCYGDITSWLAFFSKTWPLAPLLLFGVPTFPPYGLTEFEVAVHTVFKLHADFSGYEQLSQIQNFITEANER